MINRFSKMRDSWFTKIILTVTALSFMSLFGVSGYINSAAHNKAVIKVDDVEISQSEFAYMLNRDLARLRAINGDFDDDEDGTQKAMVANMLAKTKLDDAILENTMRKFNVDFSRGLIRQMIQIMPQFSNKGVFDPQLYQWFLRNSNKTEDEFILDIKRNVAHKVLVDTQVAGITVPEVLKQQMAKVIGQRRTFKYIRLNTADARITRQPSAEELDQFYEDMADELMIPEKRDVTLLYLSDEDLAKSIDISDEEIAAYYKEHIEEYEQPEKRHALQMVFDDEQEAKNAAAKLANGEDFAAVAAQYGQKSEDIDLGFVAKSNVTEELGDVIFGLRPQQVSQPVQIADSWQIIKVNAVQAPHKIAREEANRQIVDELRQEKAYDGSYEAVAVIEDAIGAGKSLEEIAAENHAELYTIKGLDDSGTAEVAAKAALPVLANREVTENAFLYNEGEVSQEVETDEGVVFVRVDKIHDEHQQPREEADGKLRQMWQESERQAITKELADNIQHDIEAGDDLATIAPRYGLRAANSRPVTRGEAIDKLTPADMKTLFTAPKGEPQMIENGDDYVFAETTNIYDDATALKAQDMAQLEQILYNSMLSDMGEALLHGYAKDYKIEVQYGRMGLND